jgi:hypothetical protein
MSGLGQGAPDLRKASERRYKVKTGARTASKTLEKAFLERFRSLGEEPGVILPVWQGPGTNPFGPLARKLRKVQAKYKADKSLKWSARGKNLTGAVAATLQILRKGKVPSFAALPLKDRQVQFIPRGRARRHQLVAVQNHEDPDLLMLGYLEYARKGKAAFWVTDEGLVATPRGAPAPEGFAESLFQPAGLQVVRRDGRILCTHADEDDAWRLEVSVDDVQERFELCRRCLDKVDAHVDRWIQRGHMGRSREPKPTLHLAGRPWEPSNESSGQRLAELVRQADAKTKTHAKGYISYSNAEYLDWGRERLKELLNTHPTGYIIVGDTIWLDDFHAAAQTYGSNPEEISLIKAALNLGPPRIETGDGSIGKLLAGIWKERARDIIVAATDLNVTAQQINHLSQRDPAEAARQMQRMLGEHERLKLFPRYRHEGVFPPLALALEAAEAWHGSGKPACMERVVAAISDPSRKVMALALARAAQEEAAHEWRFAPDEKQAAQFLVPYCQRLLEAEPSGFAQAVEQLAQALDVPMPAAR